jgi:hypothetical protein
MTTIEEAKAARVELRARFLVEGFAPVIKATGIVQDADFRHGTPEEDWANVTQLAIALLVSDLVVSPRLWLLGACELLEEIAPIAPGMATLVECYRSQVLGDAPAPAPAVKISLLGAVDALLGSHGCSRHEMGLSIITAAMSGLPEEMAWWGGAISLPCDKRAVYLALRSLVGVGSLISDWAHDGMLNIDRVVGVARDTHAALSFSKMPADKVDDVPLFEALSTAANATLVRRFKGVLTIEAMRSDMVFVTAPGARGQA